MKRFITSRAGATALAVIAMVVLVAAPAIAASGSQITVIVGGRQEPARSYVFDGWSQNSSLCQTPYSRADHYVRWYIREVRATRAYIESIYVRITPSRGGMWNGLVLYGPGGDYPIAEKYLFRDLDKGVGSGTTLSVNRWVNIERTSGSPINLRNWIDINHKPGESGVCGGLHHSFNYLFRQ